MSEGEGRHSQTDAKRERYLVLELLDDVITHRVLLATEVCRDLFLGAATEVLREVHDEWVLLRDGRVVRQDRTHIERLARCAHAPAATYSNVLSMVCVRELARARARACVLLSARSVCRNDSLTSLDMLRNTATPARDSKCTGVQGQPGRPHVTQPHCEDRPLHLGCPHKNIRHVSGCGGVGGSEKGGITARDP